MSKAVDGSVIATSSRCTHQEVCQTQDACVAPRMLPAGDREVTPSAVQLSPRRLTIREQEMVSRVGPSICKASESFHQRTDVDEVSESALSTAFLSVRGDAVAW